MSVDLFDDFMIPIMIVLDLFQVTVVELSRPSYTPPVILSNQGNYLAGADRTFKELLQDLPFSDAVFGRTNFCM